MIGRRALPFLAVPVSAAGCPEPGPVLEGPCSAGAVTVFGHAFSAGVMPTGAGLAIRAAGQALPAQIDVKTRHPDGSARLAIIAVRGPALAPGARVGLTLAPAPVASAVSSQPAGHTAFLEITAGGSTQRVNLLANPLADLWQSGPLAVQGRIVRTLPGLPSLRLVADVSLHADGAILLDTWFRNDIAMQPGGGEAAYTVRLLLDGRVVLEESMARQHQYTGWGRLLRSGPTAGHIRPDATALADAGAVHRYDVGTGVEESVLARLGQAVAAPAWRAPLGQRGITPDMRQTGGRADIGPATLGQAAWLISGDRRAADHAIGQAEAAGSIPWHFWDSREGNWLSPARWPNLWTDGRGGPPPGGLAQPIAADTGWFTDCAHQPELSLVPFLLTGRRAFLDNLQAQAAWCVFSQWPAAAARGASGGVNVVRGNQVRGAAWSLRQLDNAAWANPGSWFGSAAAANWDWIISQIPTWTRQQGETHGRIPGEYGTAGVMPPWQQDQFASTAILAARRGSPQARLVLGWMANFLVGRFTAEARGFSPRDGCAYLIATGSTPMSWAELGAATRAANLSNGLGWTKSQGDYAQLAAQTLAGIAEVLDMPTALRPREALLRAGAPFITARDFRRDPIYNIAPRCG